MANPSISSSLKTPSEPNAIKTHEEVIKDAKQKYDLAVQQWQTAKDQGKPVDELVKRMDEAKKEYDEAMTNANKPITTIETSALAAMQGLMTKKAVREVPDVIPSAVLLASTVEKHRNGDTVTTFELASVIKRLAHTTLSSDDIADRFTKAFGDVLFTPKD